MTDPRRKIIEGNNPKDLRSDYEYVTLELHEKIYVEDRKQTIKIIPNNSLKNEIILFLVEGYNDKKIWDCFVQRPKTKVHYIRIPRRKNPDEHHAGKDVIKLILARNNLKKYSSNPIAIKTKNNRVFGLIDLDFEQLSLDNPNQDCLNLYQCSPYKNLFATETNDIDTFFLCYGGFPIFIKHFSNFFFKEGGNFALTRTILDQAELLGDAFRAAKKTGIT